MRGRLDALIKYKDENILDYINRTKDIRDGFIDGFIDGLSPHFRLRLNINSNHTLMDVFDLTICTEKQFERDLLKHGPCQTTRYDNRNYSIDKPVN